MAKDLTDATAKVVSAWLKSEIGQMKISKELKALLLFVADNSKALFDFGIAYARQKATGKVDPNELMLAFLKSRGKSLADFGIKLIDSQTLSDAAAVITLIVDVRSSAKYSSLPIVGVALTIGFLFNDAGKFLANFTPAQVAYYNLFLKQSNSGISFVVPRIIGPKY